jgi:hypothetical protein
MRVLHLVGLAIGLATILLSAGKNVEILEASVGYSLVMAIGLWLTFVIGKSMPLASSIGSWMATIFFIAAGMPFMASLGCSIGFSTSTIFGWIADDRSK